MGIRKYKPTTPGRRGSSVADFVEITRTTPEKSLVRPLSKSGGRNNQGRITTRHQGGGTGRVRLDNERRRPGVPLRVPLPGPLPVLLPAAAQRRALARKSPIAARGCSRSSGPWVKAAVV